MARGRGVGAAASSTLPGIRVRRACWGGGPDAHPGGMLLAGAAVWLAYAVAWVAITGPVVDEAAVAAPIIAGALGYPAGHPNAVVYRHAPALSYQLAALEWALAPGVWPLAATRNVLFLFASAFVPFAATVACTRRPAWGHVAAALTVSEAGCSLIGVYLSWVFPGVYSTGNLGIHAAVLAVALVAVGAVGAGGFLAGLLRGRSRAVRSRVCRPAPR